MKGIKYSHGLWQKSKQWGFSEGPPASLRRQLPAAARPPPRRAGQGGTGARSPRPAPHGGFCRDEQPPRVPLRMPKSKEHLGRAPPGTHPPITSQRGRHREGLDALRYFFRKAQRLIAITVSLFSGILLIQSNKAVGLISYLQLGPGQFRCRSSCPAWCLVGCWRLSAWMGARFNYMTSSFEKILKIQRDWFHRLVFPLLELMNDALNDYRIRSQIFITGLVGFFVYFLRTANILFCVTAKQD